MDTLKTSLWGQYNKLSYSANAAASLLLNAPLGAAGSSADWSYWSIGSKTTYTVVPNLDLSVEAIYQKQKTAFSGATAPTVSDNGWWSGIVRVQRNFWP